MSRFLLALHLVEVIILSGQVPLQSTFRENWSGFYWPDRKLTVSNCYLYFENY